MDIQKIEYDFGTEYRITTDELLTSVVLQCGTTTYFWTTEYIHIMNRDHEINMMYSDVFGLRFLSEESEEEKEVLRSLFLPGMKANHSTFTYELTHTLNNHITYFRDLYL